jgi:hypothetical protein
VGERGRFDVDHRFEHVIRDALQRFSVADALHADRFVHRKRQCGEQRTERV